jgi:hypothetical protein
VTCAPALRTALRKCGEFLGVREESVISASWALSVARNDPARTGAATLGLQADGGVVPFPNGGCVQRIGRHDNKEVDVVMT